MPKVQPRPDWQSDCGTVKLCCADCLDVLPRLDRVEACVTDPPYGVMYNGSTTKVSVNGFGYAQLAKALGRLPNAFSTTESTDRNVLHPCPKPIGTMVWLVNRVSFKDETVLDPFMGSGTTGVAAVQLGRGFIGIEKHRPYFDIAVTRIKLALAQAEKERQRQAVLARYEQNGHGLQACLFDGEANGR